MLEIFKHITRNLHHYLIFILPLLLMSCGTASNSNYSINKKYDRYEAMVSYIKKTIADNPKYQTQKVKESAKVLNKFIVIIQKQVSTNKITKENATSILSAAFDQFERNTFTYKSGMKLYNNNLTPKLNIDSKKHTDPWPPEEEPLM